MDQYSYIWLQLEQLNNLYIFEALIEKDKKKKKEIEKQHSKFTNDLGKITNPTSV